MSFLHLAGEADAELLIAGASPSWILKHSSTCPISTAAHEEVAAHLAAAGGTCALVVVQEQRPLSNWLAQRLGRVHQSPQLFLVQGGQVRWAASHWSITAKAMAAAEGR